MARSTREAGQRPQREGAAQNSLPNGRHTAAPEADLTVSTKLAGLVARAKKEARLTNVIQFVDEELLHRAQTLVILASNQWGPRPFHELGSLGILAAALAPHGHLLVPACLVE